MVTKIGDQKIYDNLSMGFALNEGDETSIYVVMTDKDNEEIHMFPLALTKFEQWVNLARQTIAKQSIEVTNRMPKGPQG